MNSAPDAVDDRESTPFETPVDIAVLTNDSDPDGDPLSVVDFTQPQNGTLVLNADGTFTYTPDAGFSGDDFFNYTISDGNGGTDVATVRLHVGEPAPVNRPPEARDDSDTTEQGTPVNIDVLGNDTDPDGDPLTVTRIVDQPANGTAVLRADGTVDYTPNPNFVGTDTFTYEISDGNGGTDIATVTVTVDEEDLQPDARDDNFSGQQDQPVTGSVAGNDDPGNAPATFALDQGAANGTVVLNPDGTFTYTPNAGFSGDDSFTYTITDADGDTDTATVRLHIDAAPPVDLLPDARDDTNSTDENTPVSGSVAGNDDEGDGPARFFLATGPQNGQVVLNQDGTYTYTPNAGFSGTDTFTYTIVDQDGDTDTATVTITVNDTVPDNRPPVARNDLERTPFNTPVTVNLLGNDSDPDGDTLTVTSITQPANGTAVLNADGTVTYTPRDGFFGSDTFTYTISDGNGGTATATARVIVDREDRQPDARDDTNQTNFETPVRGNVARNDDLGDRPARFRLVDGPQNGTVQLDQFGRYTYTPNAGFSGTDTFTYEIRDRDGDVDTATVTITVGDRPNRDPIARDDRSSGPAGQPQTVNLLGNDTDPDGDPLTVTSIEGQQVSPGDVIQVSNGTVRVNADGTVTVTPDAGFVGDVVFDYHISDGRGGTADATATVTFERVNSRPDAVNDRETTDEDTSVVINVLGNDTDPDGDTLTIRGIDRQPQNGTVTINADGTITYTPNAGFTGTDNFVYRITDGNGGFDSALVTVTVEPDEPVNRDPHARKDGYYLRPGALYMLPVLHNDFDPDGDPLTITQINGHDVRPGSEIRVDGGVVKIRADGQLTFRGNRGARGNFSFNYTISDGNGGFSTAPVHICLVAPKH